MLAAPPPPPPVARILPHEPPRDLEWSSLSVAQNAGGGAKSAIATFSGPIKIHQILVLAAPEPRSTAAAAAACKVSIVDTAKAKTYDFPVSSRTGGANGPGVAIPCELYLAQGGTVEVAFDSSVPNGRGLGIAIGYSNWGQSIS